MTDFATIEQYLRSPPDDYPSVLIQLNDAESTCDSFESAIINDRLDVVIYILQNGYVDDIMINCALITSAVHDKYQIFKFIFEAVDVDDFEFNCATVITSLNFATKNNCYEIVRYLIETVDFPIDILEDLFEDIVEAGNIEMIKFIININ